MTHTSRVALTLVLLVVAVIAPTAAHAVATTLTDDGAHVDIGAATVCGEHGWLPGGPMHAVPCRERLLPVLAA